MPELELQSSEALHLLKLEQRRRQIRKRRSFVEAGYFDEPERFCRECINWPTGRSLIDYQGEAMERLNRSHRLAVRGPRGASKTAIAAFVILWFAITREMAGRRWKIATTAGSNRQLIEFLWPEIEKWAPRIKWDVVGRPPFSKDELLTKKLKLKHGHAFGASVKDKQMIEGCHEDEVLAIFDESKAIADDIFDAFEGAFSTGNAFALALSTPGDPRGRFYDICRRAPGLTRKAEALFAEAEKNLKAGGYDARRVAMQKLEQATLLDRDNPTYELLLAHTYYDAGFLGQARTRYEQVARMTPEDADGQFGLGQVWRHDWLKYLDPKSFDRAISHFSAAARLSPDNPEPWIQLVPLLVEQGELPQARSAALRGLDAARGTETLLAVAYTSYRSGLVSRADSMFRLTLPLLPKIVRERFEDIAPVATAEDTFRLHRLTPEDQVRFIARFWADNDPDLASPENEAQLEYWSRVAQAYFLFFDARRREWDQRGEVYVRYGPPRYATYNPVGELLTFRFATGPGYPMNALLWEYPELGMRVIMQDRLLTEYYLLPIAMDHDPDPQPYPDSLEQLHGALATRGGRGVFPKLPPGATPIPAEGRLPGSRGRKGRGCWRRWRPPAGPPTACGPSGWCSTPREWWWRGSAPAGGVGVRPHGAARRGLRARAPARTLPRRPHGARRRRPPRRVPGGDRSGAGGGVAGDERRRGVLRHAGTADGPQGVRIEPNPKALVGPDDPVTAYFEIYHLGPRQDGRSRFEYLYTVRSAERDPRIWIQRVLQPRGKTPRSPRAARRSTSAICAGSSSPCPSSRCRRGTTGSRSPCATRWRARKYQRRAVRERWRRRSRDYAGARSSQDGLRSAVESEQPNIRAGVGRLERRELADHAAHLLVQRAVARQDAPSLQPEHAAVPVGDGAARLAHDQHAGRHVPRRQVRLPEPVEAAAREVAQVERRRAVAADALRAHQERAEQRQRRLGMLAHVVGEAGDEQRVLEPRRRRRRGSAGRSSVAPSPRGGGEHLVAHRVVDRRRPPARPSTSAPIETQKNG